MFKFIKVFNFFFSNFSFNLNSKFIDNFFLLKKDKLNVKKMIYYLVIVNRFNNFSIERFIFSKLSVNPTKLVFSGYVEKNSITLKYYINTPLLLI